MRRFFFTFGMLAVVAAIVGCVAPAELRAAPVRVVGHHASGSSTVSDNWAGYVAEGGPYTSVTATWILSSPPSLPSADRRREVAFWVGLDGGAASSKTLEQLGTSAESARTASRATTRGGEVASRW